MAVKFNEVNFTATAGVNLATIMAVKFTEVNITAQSWVESGHPYVSEI